MSRQTKIVRREVGVLVICDVVDDLSRFRVMRDDADGRWHVCERIGREWSSLDGSFRTQREARSTVDDYVNGDDWRAA